MKQHLLRLFRYDIWANNLIVSQLISEKTDDDQILTWINHILNVQEIWFDRLNYGQSILPSPKNLDLNQLSVVLKTINQKYRELLRGSDEAELDRHRSYINSKEQAYSESLKDILTHVINHSEHHRAQILYRMRLLGNNPPVTDYIYYLREVEKK